jgi:hypothetical protein
MENVLNLKMLHLTQKRTGVEVSQESGIGCVICIHCDL